jgi:hypothetical protein
LAGSVSEQRAAQRTRQAGRSHNHDPKRT